MATNKEYRFPVTQMGERIANHHNKYGKNSGDGIVENFDRKELEVKLIRILQSDESKFADRVLLRKVLNNSKEVRNTKKLKA